ncbi:hypothetical protein I6A60_05490 [Frankia sp. AgB1.9]|uniref:GAP1-N2 domain-containing protein n=1 Tax=unclassified Frankia TaxID=2632575 RepID=UPI001932A5A2|nr:MULTISPECIES: hypothetical protein [unclassified Frankia]MBL7489628.1 hypothetical protein [Frankia sp. AgW1.1]MBL7547335.1 hypothetical protein [Frankia sp. AgB1.9]MBL7618734.1 hypothetical protein [Frankia sp. AgB1.8]
MAFDVAVYTDVLAREAIDGIDGFNFQAVSPGISGTDRQRIREGLLHRVIPSWSLAHDDLSHPPTCAYIQVDGRAYLTRGKSTGRTNSGRPGNQLTQAIVTSDLDDFVPYRPAQLYGALTWNLAKAPGAQLDPWTSPLEIRPEFEAAALMEYLRADTWAVGVLPQFLTMLDGVLADEPRKLVLLHPDLDVVMRWIALGTLFVDAETARKLQFRALVDDPRRVNAGIVGVSPEFSGTDLGTANVLDLVRRSAPGVGVSDSARVRATWFLERGADEALTAIEIAQRWEPALGSALATETARLIALPGDDLDRQAAWQTSLAAVTGLAAAGLADDLALYAEDLCEAAATYGPTSPAEFGVAAAAMRRAHEAGVDELAAGIAMPTLEALARVPAAAEIFAAELVGAARPITWGSAEAREQAGGYLTEVLAGAPLELLPELFTAALVLGATVSAERLARSAADLADLWLRDPRIGRERWRRWFGKELVVAAAAAKLVTAYRANDGVAVQRLMRGEWDFLAAADPTLAGWITAGQIGRLPATERAARLAGVATVPTEAWRVVLSSTRLPNDAALWGVWIAKRGLTADLAGLTRMWLDQALKTDPNDPNAPIPGDWSPVMRSLEDAGDPDLARIAGEYARAKTALDKARSAIYEKPNVSLDGCVSGAKAFTQLFLVEIGRLLVGSTNADGVRALLAATGPSGPTSIRVYLHRLVDTGQGSRAIALALAARERPVEVVALAVEKVLDQIAASRPEVIREARQDRSLREELQNYLTRGREPRQTPRKFGRPFNRGKEG